VGEIDDRISKTADIPRFDESFKNAVAQNCVRPETGEILHGNIKLQGFHVIKLRLLFQNRK
jgi:hypothetical protein